MIEPQRTGRMAAFLIVMVSLLAAGCVRANDGSGPPPASAPTAPGQASGSDTATPVPSTPPSEAPGPPGGFLDPAVPTACMTLGDADCERAREMAASVLAAGDPPVRYVQVGPFGCAIGDRCPTTVVARPEGDIVIEFDGDTAINVHLKVSADGTFEATRGEGMGIPVAPSSARGIPAGPEPFVLGHCGIFSGIDLDGTWWDPVGPVPMDGGEAVNATPGVITVLDPEHATFVAQTGFAVRLQRRTGSKFLPFCM